MATFDDIAVFSILPIVSLQEISEPKDGLLIPLCPTCHKNFPKGSKCKEHYSTLENLDLTEPKIRQCPYGFASIAFTVGPLRCALTGIIPFPRLGGNEERNEGKKNPESKITQQNARTVISTIIQTHNKLEKLQEDIIKNESMALHEIRKLNRTVKQTAERLYNANRTQDLLQILNTRNLSIPVRQIFS